MANRKRPLKKPAESETIRELRALGDRLKDATFTAVSHSKYYPLGSETAYWRLNGSPGKLDVRHKSPSSPVEERFEIFYRGRKDCNIASVNFYLDGRLDRTYTEEELLHSFDWRGPEWFFINVVLGDPRCVLAAAERIAKAKIGDLDAYRIVALDTPDVWPSTRVEAVLLLTEGVLATMVLYKFLNDKEITSQRSIITFTFGKTGSN